MTTQVFSCHFSTSNDVIIWRQTISPIMSSEAHNFFFSRTNARLPQQFFAQYLHTTIYTRTKFFSTLTSITFFLSFFFTFLFLVQKWVGDNKINRFTYKALGYFTSLLLARESICIGLRPLKCTFKHPWSTWRGGGEETRGVMWERQKPHMIQSPF